MVRSGAYLHARTADEMVGEDERPLTVARMSDDMVVGMMHENYAGTHMARFDAVTTALLDLSGQWSEKRCR